LRRGHVRALSLFALEAYFINQTLVEKWGEVKARARCSLYPPKFSVKGHKINYQTYYTTKSRPNLTTFPTSNHFKNNTRYKLSVFSIYSMRWLYYSCIMSKVRYGWSIQNLRRFLSKSNSPSVTLYLML